jgi:hygromycin-B 7''-O-kinase
MPDYTVTSWAEWHRYTTDITVARLIVDEICRQCVVEPGHRISVGPASSNTIYYVGDRVVIKLFCPLFPSPVVAETNAYRLLAQDTTLPVPQIITSGVLASLGWRYLVLSPMQGVPIEHVWGNLTDIEKASIVRELGHLVRRFHDLRISDESTLFDLQIEWRNLVERRIRTCLESPRCIHLPVHLKSGAYAFVDRLQRQEPKAELPCLLHGDLGAMNLLLKKTAGDWQISGLIDFGAAMAGDPLYDFIQIYFGICEAKPDLLKQAVTGYGWIYPLNANCRDRFMLYLLGKTLKRRFTRRLSRLVDLSSFANFDSLQLYLFT